MEKYNDTVSKDYFRSSNHRGVSAIKQIFLKIHRIRRLDAAGAELTLLLRVLMNLFFPPLARGQRGVTVLYLNPKTDANL